jgi:exopolyphosphatase/guanosine-5'-triphosphate,3'-diphosphate pyrophosphatase
VSRPGSGPVAAIDCGTNSTRLLVASPDGTGGLTTHERLMQITRLGAGVDATGRFAPSAVDRALDVLGEYRGLMDGHGVTAARITATSAARDAENRNAFLDAAAAVVGSRPELLTAEDEGRLSFRGATSGLDPSEGPFLVFDLGGGSTEFSMGSEDCEGTVSIDVGCVRLTEKYLEHDPPQPEELVAAISYTEAWMDDVVRGLPAALHPGRVIGLAGTVSTVAAVEIGLEVYDRDRIHHFPLTRAAIEDVFRTLATEARVDRVHNPGLEEARADVIVGGCCALVAIVRTLGVDEVLVSEADILDGLALSLIAGDDGPGG